MDLPQMNAVWLSLLSAVLGFSGVLFWKMREDKKALLARLTEVEKQTSIVKEAVIPITAAFQAILVKTLTHFHTPVMDKLMEKLGPPFTLTAKEEIQLKEELKKRAADVDDLIDQKERNAAIMLPMVMQMVKEESEILNPNVRLQVVASVTSLEPVPEASAANSPPDAKSAVEIKKQEERGGQR